MYRIVSGVLTKKDPRSRRYGAPARNMRDLVTCLPYWSMWFAGVLRQASPSRPNSKDLNDLITRLDPVLDNVREELYSLRKVIETGPATGSEEEHVIASSRIQGALAPLHATIRDYAKPEIDTASWYVDLIEDALGAVEGVDCT